MSNQWIGVRKVAFIPVFRPSIDAVPADWEAQIQRRIYFDPDSSGSDLSLRTYIYTTSYGRADLEGHVLPRVEINHVNVPVNALADRTDSLRGQGFDAAALVMLGGAGAGSAEPAGFWARFVMAEGVGVWAMELTHVLTGYWDLYIYLEAPDRWFDNMACACGTHPSAFTKEKFGWLDRSAITLHSGRTRTYDLHALGLVQPPPSGRCAAVQVGSNEPFLMIEARQMVDQFDGGIPSQGVIVYEVLTSDENPDPETIRPKIQLRTRTALAPNTAYTSGSGVKVQVTSALAGGFSVRIEDPTQHLMDRSAEFGTPPAAGLPTACIIPGLSYNIAYRDTAGRLHELWRDTQGATGTTNLTANASAPLAVGNPFAYVDTNSSMVILLYRDDDGTVRSLYWSLGPVGYDDLSDTAGAPRAAGDAVGYYDTATDQHHVIYRSGDGHLHELNWFGIAPVSYGGNLTGAISAPKAAGNPSAFINAAGVNIVVYRGVNGHIMSVYWKDGPSGLDNLSGFAGTPAPASDPSAYYTAHDDAHQVVYRTADGHLWELYWVGIAPVAGWDLAAASGAPAATGTPAAYYSVGTNTKHVMYRSANGRLHEIWWVPGGTPAHVDLTAAYGLPPATDDPAAFTVEGPNTQHVTYRGNDSHVYEVIWL